MTLFLRTQGNETVVDIDLWIKDNQGKPFIEISASIDIKNYSEVLLSLPEDERIQFIVYIDELSELRGWLWEKYFMGGVNDPTKLTDAHMRVREMLEHVADKYNLNYTED